jgi:hypothetical protein
MLPSELTALPLGFERAETVVKVLGYWLEWHSLVRSPTPLGTL